MHENTSINSNNLIIISHSARALSESATRAGWNVVSVDGFADIDTLNACVECWCLPLERGEFVKSSLHNCVNKIKQRYREAKVILGAGAEKYASYIEKVTQWQLCMNPTQVVEQIRNPQRFFEGLSNLQIPYPEVRFKPPENRELWLFKLQDRCGGTGVLRASTTEESGYWQREIFGKPFSALCITDGEELVCLGVNSQFFTSEIEGLPYIYQGALANTDVGIKFNLKTIIYISKIASYFNLVGVFSVDMIHAREEDEDVLYVLEVNPRISASFELYERINSDINLVDAHIRLCEGEQLLPDIELNESKSAYSIVYAEDDCQVPDDIEWPVWVKDRPEGSRKILKNEPICSVHADASESGVSLEALLQNRVKQILNIIN